MNRVTLTALAAGAAVLLGAWLLTSSCASKNDIKTMDPLDSYKEALKSANAIGSIPPGSEIETRALEGVKQLLSEFTEENIRGRVSGVYAEDAFFNDTLKTLRGAEAIEAYLLETAEMLKTSQVAFTDMARSGGDYYLRWEMTYESKVLSKGRDIRTIGMTHLRFNPEGKVVVHQDYWDSTRGLFEHVPVVRTGIALVKRRL